ncbi:MAG: hypothetical protein DWQ34_10175 [Planctomycetota bacterium]|nr:MAG: hypothetical protein DWQ34_10175 [Planctomycetota bacterium]REK19951.1 MAG: hypothetical protein DWQ41_26865 [Planctomycetota bacterium]REK27517.1 MAG: hypothetical protein DWQ45_25885 [Planctomycetota bacterium]
MQNLLTDMMPYAPLLIASAAIVVVGLLIATLGNKTRSVIGHVCRVGRKPARLEVPQCQGPIALSVRTIDPQHVWMRIEAPTDTTLRIAGDGEESRELRCSCKPTPRQGV